MKSCIHCQRVLPLNLFYAHSGSKDGFKGGCKECMSARYKERYAASPEARKAKAREYYAGNAAYILERNRAYRAATPKACAQRCRDYREAHSEHLKQVAKEWRQANPARKRALNVKYRAACLRALPPWADLDAIRAVYQRCSDLTQSTGVPHHVDHVVPLQSPIVSGLHVHYNLEVVPAVDNLVKGNKLMETAHV